MEDKYISWIREAMESHKGQSQSYITSFLCVSICQYLDIAYRYRIGLFFSFAMSGQKQELKSRNLGGVEHTWCRVIPGGTGVTVLANLVSEAPDMVAFRHVLRKLEESHPILRSKLHFNSTTGKFSFVLSPACSNVQVKQFDISSTFGILERLSGRKDNSSVSPFHLILEHELNQNSAWREVGAGGADMFFVTIYALPISKWVVVFRLHGMACDRTTAVSLLRELLLMADGEQKGAAQIRDGALNPGIEDLIPSGKAKKHVWTRGVDVLTHSYNSIRLTNLKFKDTKSPRSSQVVRLQMNEVDTRTLVAGCESRGIKLCGPLAAAALIAAHSSRDRSFRQQKKYAVVTITDCRSSLDPPLQSHQYGFYQSSLLHTHVVKGGEKLWELAEKTYKAFSDSKSCNKHFTDIADYNFLMTKAMENPSLTASSSLRISLVTVFEDTVIDDSKETRKRAGVDDYMGCASTHGIGPSIAIFDTIRDGCLDCICVYPSPLHSREQMQRLVDDMAAVLAQGAAPPGL